MSGADDLAAVLRGGSRRALARAVTLVESTRPDHREEAERLIEAILPATGDATRIGITGPPGAGKSTFIERFGLDGIGRGHRIAVLVVDPGSKRGGGAILGDKTRMTELARAPAAFIRPSSAGAQAGGVARRTREAILVCEAAGFARGWERAAPGRGGALGRRRPRCGPRSATAFSTASAPRRRSPSGSRRSSARSPPASAPPPRPPVICSRRFSGRKRRSRRAE